MCKSSYFHAKEMIHAKVTFGKQIMWFHYRQNNMCLDNVIFFSGRMVCFPVSLLACNTFYFKLIKHFRNQHARSKIPLWENIIQCNVLWEQQTIKIKMEEGMFISHSTAIRDPQIQFQLKSFINMFYVIFQTMYHYISNLQLQELWRLK